MSNKLKVFLAIVLFIILGISAFVWTKDRYGAQPVDEFLFAPCPGGDRVNVVKLYKSKGENLEHIRTRADTFGEHPLDECPIPTRYILYE